MFIQVEDTPNPETMRFLTGESVTGGEAVVFDREEDAVGVSPLAEVVLALEGVKSVLLGDVFVAVTKELSAPWDTLKTHVFAALMDHFVEGKPVLLGPLPQKATDTDEDPDVQRIKELIEHNIRPSVARDGGDVVFHGYEDGVVYLEMRGACAGCPSATMTLKMGIESLLRHYVPSIQTVCAVSP